MVKRFNSEKMIQKIAVEHNGILYSKAILEESLELRGGHLVDYVNLECFTGVSYKVPVLDAFSPLSISIARVEKKAGFIFKKRPGRWFILVFICFLYLKTAFINTISSRILQLYS